MDTDNCMTDCGYQLVEDLMYKGNPVYTKPTDNSSMSMGEDLVEPMGPPPPMERTDVITESSPMSTEPMSTSPVSTEPMSTSPMSTEPMSTSPVSTEPMSTSPVSTEPMSTEPIGPPPPMERTDVITEASPDSSSPSREMGGRKSRRVRGKKSRKSRKSRKSKKQIRR